MEFNHFKKTLKVIFHNENYPIQKTNITLQPYKSNVSIEKQPYRITVKIMENQPIYNFKL